MYIFSPTFETLLIYFLGATALSLVLFILPAILAPSSFSIERLSAYECGFEPFIPPREVFESHFIVVAILFIIFDLEIIFLLPWAASGGTLGGVSGFWSVFVFLWVLVLGLVYEWRRGGMAWPIFFMFRRKNYFN